MATIERGPRAGLLRFGPAVWLMFHEYISRDALLAFYRPLTKAAKLLGGLDVVNWYISFWQF